MTLSNHEKFIGTRMGRDGVFEIVRFIVSGGSSHIYEAIDHKTGNRVAMKILDPVKTRDPGFLKRFMREGKRFGRVRHPNVIRVRALGTQDDLLYLASELVEGQDLYQILSSKGCLPLPEALSICIDIASGLAAAHDVGVVHRDLKPENIMIRSSDHCVKILDFGIAKDMDGTTTGLTQAGVYIGTPGYSAPEQVRGDQVDQRVDIFSLGVILYEMLAGRLPFKGRTTTEVLDATMMLPPIPLERINDETVGPVAELVKGMTQKRPERRPTDMSVVIAKLEEIRSSEQG